MAREYFCAYHSFLTDWAELSDQEAGRLFRACLTYSMSGTIEQLSGNERYLFPQLRRMIDEHNAAYENKCATNRENASKRTQAIGSERKPSVANASETPQEEEKEEEYNIPPKSPKRGVKVFEQEDSAYKVAKFLSDCIVDRLGIKPHPDATIQQWADAIDKVNRIDGRPWPEIAKVMEWCQYDSFWQANILSGAKFREKYPQLLSNVVKEENNA
jgi:hypothetical protein